MNFFTVDSISLQFGGLKAVDSVSFSVAKGEVEPHEDLLDAAHREFF